MPIFAQNPMFLIIENKNYLRNNKSQQQKRYPLGKCSLWVSLLLSTVYAFINRF